jgi:hypothetical protein
MGLKENLNCEGIEVEEESAFHFLCACSSYSSLRTRIIGKPILSMQKFQRFASSSGRFGADF